MRRPSRSLLISGAACAVLAGTHLVATAAAPGGAWAAGTQVLLMPSLAAVLAAGTDLSRPLPRRVLAALSLSWLGDSLPKLTDHEDLAFGLMLGPFLLAQGAYIRAFAPLRAAGILGLRPVPRAAALMPYAAALTGIVTLCAPGAGPMLPAVLVYGGALASMAVLATGLGPLGALGGAIFLVSDAMIGLETFAGRALPGHELWVMATYIGGQTLLVLGVRRATPPAAA